MAITPLTVITGTNFGTNGKPVCDFLCLNTINFTPILRCFRDMADRWSALAGNESLILGLRNLTVRCEVYCMYLFVCIYLHQATWPISQRNYEKRQAEKNSPKVTVQLA